MYKRNYDPKKDFMKAILKQILGFKKGFKNIKEAAEKSLKGLSKEYGIICIEGSRPTKLFGFGL